MVHYWENNFPWTFYFWNIWFSNSSFEKWHLRLNKNRDLVELSFSEDIIPALPEITVYKGRWFLVTLHIICVPGMKVIKYLRYTYYLTRFLIGTEDKCDKALASFFKGLQSNGKKIFWTRGGKNCNSRYIQRINMGAKKESNTQSLNTET